ncbi:MAG: M23 family metallopeptidase [Prochlorotrichaceae cyanobacterium]
MILNIRHWFPRSLSSLLTSAIVFGVANLAQALTVQVSSTQPKQGDTIVVWVETTDPSPKLQWGQKTYPLFQVQDRRFRALIPTTPLDPPGGYTLTVQGEGQQKPYALSVQRRSFPTQYLSIPLTDGAELDPYEFDQVDAFKTLRTPQKFWSGPFLRPTTGPVSSLYGVRRYYAGEFAEDYYHRGVDYAADTGTPVVAPASGRVSLVGWADRFVVHGNTVGLDHGQGVLSIFLHLSRINVKEGQFVQAGEVIGRVGSTGASTGPHLHWGLYVNGQAVDPVPWRYDGIE